MRIYNPNANADAQNTTLVVCDILNVMHLVKADFVVNLFMEKRLSGKGRDTQMLLYPWGYDVITERAGVVSHSALAHHASQSLKN